MIRPFSTTPTADPDHAGLARSVAGGDGRTRHNRRRAGLAGRAEASRALRRGAAAARRAGGVRSGCIASNAPAVTRAPTPSAIFFIRFKPATPPRRELSRAARRRSTGRLTRLRQDESGARRAGKSGIRGQARLHAATEPTNQCNFSRHFFWVFLAVVIALFASRNWGPVTLNLWGDIQADIKIPVLLALVFLLGFLPTWLVMRAKVWGLQRRLEAHERNLAPPPPVASHPDRSRARLRHRGHARVNPIYVAIDTPDLDARTRRWRSRSRATSAGSSWASNSSPPTGPTACARSRRSACRSSSI